MTDPETSSSQIPTDAQLEQTRTLPWVEKYRPRGFEDIYGNGFIIETIKRLIETNQLPHLLLYGPPGTGKTTTILACARLMYGNAAPSMSMELNASDERGIDVVREQIKNFASTRQIFNSGVKLIILDEADAMTSAAQAAMRRVMEQYSRNTRFCLICNRSSKLIPAIQSRCTRFRFGPVSREAATSVIKRIAEAEKLEVAEDGMDTLVRIGNGDLRQIINVMQATHMAYGAISKTTLYQSTAHPSPEEIKELLSTLLNSPFNNAVDALMTMIVNNGIALGDVIGELLAFILRMKDFPAQAKALLLSQLSQCEHRNAIGCSLKLSVCSLVGAFQQSRENAIKQTKE